MVPRTSSGRWLVGIGVAVALLAVASILVTVFAGDAEALPEGSPERAVQDYLLALQDRDYEKAYGFLDPEVQDACSLQEYQRSISQHGQSQTRIRLGSVETLSGGAEVTLRITTIYSGAPIPSEYTHSYRYFLNQADDGWRISEAQWPWSHCFSFPLRDLERMREQEMGIEETQRPVTEEPKP